MATENEPDPPATLADANTQLTITTNLPDTLCPGEPIEVCANLSQRCGGNLVPLLGRKLIFFANAGDCGANVGQAGEDTVLTDAQGNACFSVTVSGDTGLFAIRVKFQGEDKPDPCPEIGNNGCSPSDPVSNKRCINLSATNACIVYIVDSSTCGCGEPVINCPAYVTQANDAGQCGATVGFDVQASGRCEPITISCIPPAGSFFLVGTTSVTCTATDTAGNSISCSFPATVQDTEPPQITCPGNISVSTGPNQGSGVPVNYLASAVDNCASAPVSCLPPSGSLFPVGVTVVTCTTSDASENSGFCSFTVTVNSFLFFQQRGVNAGDQLGFAVAGGGDVNGDGFSDFLVSLPGADVGGAGNSAALPDAGSVEVLSGVDGSLLYQVDGSNGGDRIGGSLGIDGDIDADGSADIIVGAPEADVNGMADAGAAYVYSGDDGVLLFEIKGSVSADRLGGSVGIIEDVDTDGHDDFLVGVPGYDVGGAGSSAALPDAGAVFIYSGANGALLYQIEGAGAGDRIGGSLDVSGEDFIVGAPEADVNGMVDAGAAYAYSGSGQLTFQAYGTEEGDRLGGSVGISEDINKIFIVGASDADVNGIADAGAAYVYSSSSGQLIFQVYGTEDGDRLGGSVGISGDVNADGYKDFVVAAPFADPNGLADAGSVTVYSGSDGTALFQADGASSGDQLGSSATMFAATTEGGAVRFLLGAPKADGDSEPDAGAAAVYQITFKGDLNGDGELAASDLVILLNCIFLGRGHCPPELADLNCDGSILNPTDVVILLNAIFLETPIACGP